MMTELDNRNLYKLIPGVKAADLNTMFALSILERKANGRVFIDDVHSPGACYIQHPCGMSLLYGESGKEKFYKQLADFMLNSDHVRDEFEFLQVYPNSLYVKIDEILGANLVKKDPEQPYENSYSQEEDKKVLEYRRINYSFNKEKYLLIKRNLKTGDFKVITTTEEIFHQSDGSVIPKHFWNNYNEFIKYGIGYTLLLNSRHSVSTAFAAFTCDDKLEIGIETHAENQNSGYASIVCSHLIDYCIANGLEPVWSCKSGNIGSRRLAEKLGFEESKRVPYYRLSR